MSDYQEQIIDGLPFSLARSVAASGGVNDAKLFIPFVSPFATGPQVSSDGATPTDFVTDPVNGTELYDLVINLDALKQVQLRVYTNAAGSAGTKAGFLCSPDGNTGVNLVSGGLFVLVDQAEVWTDSGWQMIDPSFTGDNHIHWAGLDGNNFVTMATVGAVYLSLK